MSAILCEDWFIREQGEEISQMLQSDEIFRPINNVENGEGSIQEYSIDRDAYATYPSGSIRKRNIFKWEDYINSLELDEYILDSIRNGPANNFFDSLESFNNDYSHHFQRMVEEGEARFKLDVYDKSLRWKRGTYNHLKDWMKEYLLDENKRPCGIRSIYDRVYNNMYLFERMAGRISTLEQMRKEALDSGFGRDIDEEAVLESFSQFIQIPNQELMNDSMKFEYYIQDEQNIRDTKGIIAITMKKEHFKMNVCHGGEYQIAEIPYSGDVQILYFFPLFKRFADYYSGRPYGSSITKNKVRYVGRYAVNHPSRFPWISGDSNKKLYYQNRHNEEMHTIEDAMEYVYGGWANCCWGGFQTTIENSFYSLDHNAIIMALTQWGTYYDNENSNPHNNIKTFHLGLEDGGVYEEDYENLTGYDESVFRSLIQSFYDISSVDSRILKEYCISGYGSEQEQDDYRDCLIEQITGLSPQFFIKWFKSPRICGNRLIEMADYGSRQIATERLEDHLETLLQRLEWYDYEDGGELEDQDGEISVPEGMEQWAGTRVVSPRAPGRFSNVLESTDETTRLERERIAARQQLNNI